MQNLSMTKLFLKLVKEINPRFRESTSSLSKLFKEMRNQCERVCGRGDRPDRISGETLERIITGVQGKNRAQKYQDAIAWLRQRWGYNNNILGNGVGRFWSLLEVEDNLYGRINKKLEQNNFGISNEVRILHRILKAQHELVKERFDTDQARDLLFKSFVPMTQQYSDRVLALVNNNPTRADQWGAPNGYDLNVVLTLAVVKMNAFETGRRLLNKIGEIRGARRLNLCTSDGYKADFLNPGNLEPSLKILKSHLGLPDFIEARFKQTGTKYFDDSLRNLFKIARRGPAVNRDVSLVFVYRPYSWHQIHIGYRSAMGGSNPQLTWYLSPHYIQVYHELCHVVRLLESSAFPLEPQVLHPVLVDSYGNTEEYFNIRVAQFSEWALLKEIGEYPLRLTHSGLTMPGPANDPPAHPVYRDLEKNMRDFFRQDVRTISEKAKKEMRK